MLTPSPFVAFLVGLASLAWIGFGYVGTNPLALAVTLLILGFFLLGAWELRGFQQATQALDRALARIPEPLPHLGAWLSELPVGLQNAVRLRVEGERVGLPGPALAPYLSGLLVLLGMLGTFVGMVVTLDGTGRALDHAGDLTAIRAVLSAPVKGLGLAFGTSIAGVAASAMLGLMAALARRERLHTALRLDTCIATTLRVFSRSHQREESFRLLQRQAQGLPELVACLQALAVTMQQQGAAQQAQLLASQERFHAHAVQAYGALASSVDRSLQTSLSDSARAATATIQPIVEATLAGVAREASALHEDLSARVRQQLDGMSSRLEASHQQMTTQWQAALDEQQRLNTALLGTVARTHDDLLVQAASRDQQRLAAWTTTLTDTARDITTQAEAQGRQTLAELRALMQAAGEAPRAAAEAMAELRGQLSDSLVRDNEVLDERRRMLATLATLLDTVNHAASQQRGAVETLVASSAALLDQMGQRFSASAEAASERLASVAAQTTSSAAEVASLGEAFGAAVQVFGASNQQLVAQLQGVEAALSQSMARSDEQLAYYVAQAREVIDLSLLSQKQIVEDLQQLARRPLAVGSAA